MLLLFVTLAGCRKSLSDAEALRLISERYDAQEPATGRVPTGEFKFLVQPAESVSAPEDYFFAQVGARKEIQYLVDRGFSTLKFAGTREEWVYPMGNRLLAVYELTLTDAAKPFLPPGEPNVLNNLQLVILGRKRPKAVKSKLVEENRAKVYFDEYLEKTPLYDGAPKFYTVTADPSPMTARLISDGKQWSLETIEQGTH